MRGMALAWESGTVWQEQNGMAGAERYDRNFPGTDRDGRQYGRTLSAQVARWDRPEPEAAMQWADA